MNIRKRGVDTAVLLRNQLTRVGVEMWFKIFSPAIEGFDLVQKAKKRARRAKLYYLRYVCLWRGWSDGGGSADRMIGSRNTTLGRCRTWSLRTRDRGTCCVDDRRCSRSARRARESEGGAKIGDDDGWVVGFVWYFGLYDISSRNGPGPWEFLQNTPRASSGGESLRVAKHLTRVQVQIDSKRILIYTGFRKHALRHG